MGWVIEVLPHVRLILRLPHDRNSEPSSEPGEELESVINDGFPRGSTSNYFRTRAALLNGVVERMVERAMPGVGAAFSPSSVDDFADAAPRSISL